MYLGRHRHDRGHHLRAHDHGRHFTQKNNTPRTWIIQNPMLGYMLLFSQYILTIFNQFPYSIWHIR